MLGGSKQRRRAKYRSSRAVKPPSHVVTEWTRTKVVLLLIGGFAIALLMWTPIALLELPSNQTDESHVGLGRLIKSSMMIKKNWKQFIQKEREFIQKEISYFRGGHPLDEEEERVPQETLPPQNEETDKEHISLARGVSGLPIEETPALKGAKHGTVRCEADVDDLAYWNEPQGLRDRQFRSPFHVHDKSIFLTFEPDLGGWNNIRMSLENILVLAAATGRTLVLPPKEPLYLLGMGEDGARSFGNFFDLTGRDFQKQVHVISMEEFLRDHGEDELGLSKQEIADLMPLAKLCVFRQGDEMHCDKLYSKLRPKGWQPNIQPDKHCLIMDERTFQGSEALPEDTMERIQRFCGKGRQAVFYNSTWASHSLLHWQTREMDHRLLTHFYTFLHFTNPVLDNFYKRFVRDHLHYKPEIFCAAGKIVNTLREEFGDFVTWHVRRGDFQYKETRLPIEEWYNNTKHMMNDNDLIYIATDERNKTFFEPLKTQFGRDYRMLSDFPEVDKMDSTFLGMIDTVVAAQGREFAGTWFSTYTGYINRIRGYQGKSMKHSWYSWLERKDRMQTWEYPNGNYPAREWPIAWTGIDGDEWVEDEIDSTAETLGEDKAVSAGLVKKARLGVKGETVTVGDLKKSKVKGSKSPIEKSADEKRIERVKKKREKMKNQIPDEPPVDRHVPEITVSQLESDTGFTTKPVGRGIAGRPETETPAVVGASRGHIECDVNVDSLAYWNNPQGDHDRKFVSPFRVTGNKYITFAPDRGGWNNIRMSMEIIFIFALVTGRTLVLPPEIKFYLLVQKDDTDKHKSFADFYPLHSKEFQEKISVITMTEFLQREGGPEGRIPVPKDENHDVIFRAAEYCDNMQKSQRSCMAVNEYLEGAGYHPTFRAEDGCVVFDEDVYSGKPPSESSQEHADHVCGKRNVTWWEPAMEEPTLIHFHANDKRYRLLTHFYSMLHFTSPSIDNYVKRFVRDFMHYHDQIFCAAGKIVKALQLEAKQRGFPVDGSGGGGYSAMHIRRGDLQFEKVKISAQEWWNNTEEIWQPKELLYIASDERNKSFFNPIAQNADIRFLDDYYDMAGLDGLDKNYFGMIETIICSRARAFAGTWFSTFTGFINRMRGYHGMSMMNSWYSFPLRKTALHNWTHVDHYAYAYEWPTGWMGIDADVWPTKDVF